MADSLYERGREGFLDGTIDHDTHTQKFILLDLHTADTGVKAISGATNATPIVVTATAHGFTTGDIVFIDGVAGNAAANGKWKITVVDANSFSLQRLDGTNVVGSGAYTSGGYAVCLGPSAAGDNLDDFDGCRVGTDVTLTSPTVASGVADCADPTWSAVSGATVEAAGLYKDTGTASTSRMVALITTRQIVTVAADAALSATSIAVEALRADIPSGAVLTFSNGVSATLSANALAGARTISVTALGAAITAGHVALAVTGLTAAARFPFTPNGGSLTLTIDNGSNRLFKL